MRKQPKKRSIENEHQEDKIVKRSFAKKPVAVKKEQSAAVDKDVELFNQFKEFMNAAKVTSRQQNVSGRIVSHNYDDGQEASLSDEDNDFYMAAGISNGIPMFDDDDDHSIQVVEEEHASELFTMNELSNHYELIQVADEQYEQLISSGGVINSIMSIPKIIQLNLDSLYQNDGQLTNEDEDSIPLSMSMIFCVYYPNYRIYCQPVRDLQQHELLIARYHHQSNCTVCQATKTTNAWINLFLCSAIRYAVLAKRHMINVHLAVISIDNTKHRNQLQRISRDNDYKATICDIQLTCTNHILQKFIPDACPLGVMVKLYASSFMQQLKCNLYSVHDSIMAHSRCVGYNSRYPVDPFGILRNVNELYDFQHYGMFILNTSHDSVDDEEVQTTIPSRLITVKNSLHYNPVNSRNSYKDYRRIMKRMRRKRVKKLQMLPLSAFELSPTDQYTEPYGNCHLDYQSSDDEY